MGDFEDLRNMDKRLAEQIERRQALRDAIARILGEEADPDIEWGDAVPRTVEGMKQFARDIIEAGVIKHDVPDPYGAFAGRNFESPDFGPVIAEMDRGIQMVAGQYVRPMPLQVKDYGADHYPERMYAVPPEHHP